MANLPETSEWEDGIYQLEPTDRVMGGARGIANFQAIQLGNRTAYLKGQMDSGEQGRQAGQKHLLSE
jgi:hypothetical protein